MTLDACCHVQIYLIRSAPRIQLRHDDGCPCLQRGPIGDAARGKVLLAVTNLLILRARLGLPADVTVMAR